MRFALKKGPQGPFCFIKGPRFQKVAPSEGQTLDLPQTSITSCLAINGYGRIGRCFLRALLESPVAHNLQVVAINEPANLESMAYLTRYDSTHGRFPGQVELAGRHTDRRRSTIAVSHARRRKTVDWRGLGIDLVIESSGSYGQRAELARFIDAGCPRLLLSHPGNSGSDVDATIVAGINQHSLNGVKNWFPLPPARPMPSSRCSTCSTAKSASNRCCSRRCIR
jgi:hypothetical protein